MDHSTTSGTITFTPTNTQQIISIPIINDMVRENRETLTVRLTNAPARVSLAPDKAWISIVDNDSKCILLHAHCKLLPATVLCRNSPQVL